MSIKYLSPAKVNLMLKVTGVRPNGYHDICSIMQNLAIYDELVFDFDAPSFSIICDNPLVPVDSSNIIFKCWRLIKEKYSLPGEVCVSVKKNIPLAAGLAGGSGNGAAMLIAANDYYELGLSKQELSDIGVKVGADLPYCIHGGTALVSGIGENVKKLPELAKMWMVLVNPGIQVNTAAVYKEYDSLNYADNYDYHKFITSVEQGDLQYIKDNLYNDLSLATENWYVVIADIRNQMTAEGLSSLMSGSGATVFGIADDEKSAKDFYAKYMKIYPNIWIGHTSKEGVICGEAITTN